jgi:hypothetical protein
MTTSSYARDGRRPNAVAISRGVPDWFRRRRYPQLAPSRELIAIQNAALFAARYRREVLAKLDPKAVFRELGDSAVLLCYEKPGEFCHRRLVAEWLEERLGIQVPEQMFSRPGPNRLLLEEK